MFLSNGEEFDESQDLGEKDSERQLPKSPSLPPALSPARQRSPGTPPYTPPVYASQSQIYQTYNTTGSPGIKSPPIGELTSLGMNGLMSPTTNGSREDKCFVQNYSEVKQPSQRKPPSDKLIFFGVISCPDFQMDPTSAHHEREVTKDGRTLRNKKTDIFSSSDIDLENSLVQYKGAIGTIPLQEQGKFYYEVDVVYNIQQPLEETWLVFEIGLCRLDDVDMHHTVERHEYARSFYVARYPEDGKLTMKFWHNRDLLNIIPLSDNTSGIEMRIMYGFLVDTRRKKWVIADCNNNKVLHSLISLTFRRRFIQYLVAITLTFAPLN